MSRSAYQCNLRFLEAGILLSGVRRGGFCKLWHPEYVARQHLACGRLFGKSMLSAGNMSVLIAVMIAVAFYVVALLFSRAISKDDVAMLPKGEKIAKILEKYGLMG